jgi:two-component system, OmpR family, sensor histidine kinase VicK
VVTYYVLVFAVTSPTNKSEILYGVENAIGRGLYFMSNVKEKMDIFFDHRAPSIVVGVEEYKKGYIEIRSRGGKIRALTEITENNLIYCKKLIELVDELRHLDGIKGGMAVNGLEYMATTQLLKSKPSTHVIYSNVKEVVEQGQYIFDTLWNAAIPAEKKIREIEMGSVPAAEPATIIENNPEEIIKQNRRIAESSKQLSACLTSGGMQYSHKYFYDIEKKLLDKQRRGEHKGIRYITKIDRENIELVKKYLKSGTQIKHTRSLPPMSFGFSDKEIAATIDKMEHGKRAQNLLISNESAYLKHFGSIFEELWNNGVDAADRIKDIEEGIDLTEIEIITNPREGIGRAWSAIKRSKEEILIMFSSANALRRQILMGGLGLLKDASERRNIHVKLLIPHENDQRILSTIIQESKSYCPKVDFRSMERGFCTRITIVIVDKKECIITELKDDSKDISYKAAGLSTYSDSKSIVSSYVSIFQSIWKQTDLYEQLKIHDKMQKEFINVAAHELRTPIQPILGLSENLLSSEGTIEEYRDILNVISRNAIRLQRIAENVLDVTRIESGALPLNKHHIRLRDLVLGIIADYKNRKYGRSKKSKLFFHIENDGVDESRIIVDADEERLTQVIYNLLSNATKFVNKGGRIDVKIKRLKKTRQVVISVSNTGKGIDPEIYPRLFTKFATNSFVGTGLGLYIAKNLVEAHGGRIWAKDNHDGKGATFFVSLPLVRP